MKVLLTSASFLPSYGGPAYSVSSLARHLSALGLDVAIWAPDGSAPAAPALATSAPAEGMPIACEGTLGDALKRFGWPDIFHDSGLWWRHNREIAVRTRSVGAPLVVSVRGMLEPSALRHRGWRKKVAWQLFQKGNLERAAALHVTSELEAGNVRAFGLRPDIVCIPNGLEVSASCPRWDERKRNTVAFLGRLHPIKGLPMLIEAWARVAPRNWMLEIAGPDEGGHLKALEAQVQRLQLSSTVVFVGPVAGAGKQDLLARARVFVLPSLSENFGIAAGEALAHGLPVIATRGTPWSRLEAEGCGWYVDTSVDGLASGLRAALATPPAMLAEMGRRGHAYVARAFSWSRAAEDMAALYRRLLQRTECGQRAPTGGNVLTPTR